MVRLARRADEDGEPQEPLPSTGERCVILALQRGDKLLPMTPTLTPRAGDAAIVVLHAPEREPALELLRAHGWELPAPLEAEG